MTIIRRSSASRRSQRCRAAIFKKGFVEIQACSALKKPQTTFGTVNFDYIADRDPTFRKPNACERIRNTPWPN
jgi:hypothetical protein